MSKSGIREDALVALSHIQRVYAFEIHKRGVRDGALPAPSHIQRVDNFLDSKTQRL